MNKLFNNMKLSRKMLVAPAVIFIFLLVIALGTYQAIHLVSKEAYFEVVPGMDLFVNCGYYK